MADDIIISDLGVCEPAHALDRGVRQQTWRLIDYATESFSGTMIYAGPGMDAGPLTLPLNVKGYHRIFVGVHYPVFAEAHVRLRLTDDSAYSIIRAEAQSEKDRRGLPDEFSDCFTGKAFREHQVSEAYWKTTDLTDQQIIISRFNEGCPGQGGNYADMYSNLVFIRLEPLDKEMIIAYQQELPNEKTRRIFAMNDGGIFINIRTREDIWAQLEPYRDSDVSVMLWATFKGENCTYRSRIARSLPTHYNPYDRFAIGDRWHETLSSLEAQGIDFMTEVIAAAHHMGIRIFPSLRLQSATKPLPRDLAAESFHTLHPEWQSRDKQGQLTGRLSLAYPEVRAFWISLLSEAMMFGFDGAHLIFCRSWPFVYYDEPVIEQFRDEYGEDPRQCPDDDPRFQKVMATYVTQFVREVKAAMDDLSQKMDKPLEIAYNVNTTPESNLKWGIDVETWVQEGLLDYLMPHPTNAKNAADWLPWYVDLLKETSVKLYPDLYPRRQPPAASLYSADTLYDIGVDGLTMWDTYSRVFRVSEWAMMKRLGHREDIKMWRQENKGHDYFCMHNFTWFGDRSADPRFLHSDG